MSEEFADIIVVGAGPTGLGAATFISSFFNSTKTTFVPANAPLPKVHIILSLNIYNRRIIAESLLFLITSQIWYSNLNLL